MGVRPARWVGSSPQMRGALKACALYISHNRIIPADAGSTPSIARTIPSSRDHPRRCGEHCSAFALSIFESGSSPQMRGALSYWHNRQTRQPIQAIGDHPRRCGEHPDLGGLDGGRRGSSPQMRGAHRHRDIAERHVRIIPADAGSTIVFFRCFNTTWDHPRRCGEHLVLCCWTAQGRGSSPQMRGAHDSRHSEPDRRGIIPADAGSTGRWGGPVSWRQDHPRRCGEHTLVGDFHSVQLGSSPQMRGAPAFRSVPVAGDGIIPADAGSTLGRVRKSG